LKIERPLSQPYGCQLPFQGEPLENGKLLPQSKSQSDFASSLREGACNAFLFEQGLLAVEEV